MMVGRSDLRGRQSHVALGADAYACDAAVVVEIEVHTLPLAEHAKERALERVRREHELGAIGVADDDALAGSGVVDTDDALHRQGFCTLPALRHDVHTWMRRGAPFTSARTRCTLGFHRRFVRRCEWLSRIPNCGF